MENKINNIKENLEEDLKNISTSIDLANIKAKYLGKQGLVTELSSMLKDIPNEEKRSFGILLNNIKNEVNNKLNIKDEEIKEEELNKKMQKESIDISLPAYNIETGSSSILEKLIEDIEQVFISLGFDVEDGPEIEEDLYNFELLNIPKNHPARDAQDTFYIEDDKILLRSQTSPVQARVMQEKKGSMPVRMICPGKTYRRDNDDATHSHQFTQIEGLLVDKNISLTDLKGTIDTVCKEIFGDNIDIRFRPSYYQFTEPSVEVDMTCNTCGGKGCSVCKNTGWITVCGAGMVHPNVLRNCGYDPSIWSGFAFGFGAERLAMLKYGISDLRVFYQNDLREIKPFERRDKND